MPSVIPCVSQFPSCLRLIRTVGASIGMKSEDLTKMKTTVHEDTFGTLILANMEPGRSTPKSKHFCVRLLHWFRSQLAHNNIVVEKIASELQVAGCLTKSLRTVKFEINRKLLMGWMAKTLSDKVYGFPSVTLSASRGSVKRGALV